MYKFICFLLISSATSLPLRDSPCQSVFTPRYEQQADELYDAISRTSGNTIVFHFSTPHAQIYLNSVESASFDNRNATIHSINFNETNQALPARVSKNDPVLGAESGVKNDDSNGEIQNKLLATLLSKGRTKIGIINFSGSVTLGDGNRLLGEKDESEEREMMEIVSSTIKPEKLTRESSITDFLQRQRKAQELSRVDDY